MLADSQVHQRHSSTSTFTAHRAHFLRISVSTSPSHFSPPPLSIIAIFKLDRLPCPNGHTAHLQICNFTYTFLFNTISLGCCTSGLQHFNGRGCDRCGWWRDRTEMKSNEMWASEMGTLFLGCGDTRALDTYEEHCVENPSWGASCNNVSNSWSMVWLIDWSVRCFKREVDLLGLRGGGSA